jgi:AcrR family transcriptional regulator
MLVLALVGRTYYIDHVYGLGITDLELLDSVAAAVQLYLFPTTPETVLSERPPRREWLPTHRAGPFARPLPERPEPRRGPFDGVSEQAAVTVRQLLDAAGRVFAAYGYDAATVDHIVAEAGLARGTFYRYFPDKLALMTTLADETSAVMCPMFDELGRIAPRREGAALRDWLQRFLTMQRGSAGVLRAWTEGFPVDPVVLAPSAAVVAALDRAARATFGPPRRYALHPRASVPLLNGALVGLPNQVAGTSAEPDDTTIVEAQARFIERVLLPRKETSR